jgi:hypothetical protein
LPDSALEASPALFSNLLLWSPREKQDIELLSAKRPSAPVPLVNFIYAAWRGGESHAQQTAISEFSFPHDLSLGNGSIGDSDCVCTDGRGDPISASANIPSDL